MLQTPQTRFVVFLLIISEFGVGGGASNDMSGFFDLLTLTPII